MPLYLFMIHAFIPNVVSLRVPLYIEASDQAAAQQQADQLIVAFSSQFQLLFPPSAPVPLVPSVNGPTFDALINEARRQPTVSINLPIGHGFLLRQHLSAAASLSVLEARSLILGSHSMVYAL